jgi:hypothetical protein
MNLKLQNMTAASLPLTRDQKVNPNNVGAFLNMLEKGATKNNLSKTLGNTLKIDESGIQNK